MARKTPAQYLTQLRSIARSRGGKVLSDAYVDDVTKLRFRCAEGHEWVTGPGTIKQGRWCPVCGLARRAAARKAPAIARLHVLVARRGGVVLSPEYVNSQTKLRFRCAEGHVWDAVPESVLQGTWCRVCSHTYREDHAVRRQRVFSRLRAIAQTRGGEVLSTATSGLPGNELAKARPRRPEPRSR